MLVPQLARTCITCSMKESVGHKARYVFSHKQKSREWVFILSWRAQGLRRPLPVCVMLLLMRLFGASAVGYDAGAKGEVYSHQRMLSTGTDAIQCFVRDCMEDKLPVARWASCQGGDRIKGELFCQRCWDHPD